MVLDALEDVTAWSRMEWTGDLYDVAEPPAVQGRGRARHWTLELRRRPS